MESSLTIDDMINNPDLLLSAVNETFASDTTQQYNDTTVLYAANTLSVYTSTCSTDAAITTVKDSSH